jgi:outer membrane biosynthesis protein TonB
MAARDGRCTNALYCSVASAEEIITLHDDDAFLCPKCGKGLQAASQQSGRAAGGGVKLMPLLAGGLALGGVALAAGFFVVGQHPASAPVAAPMARPAPAAALAPVPAPQAAAVVAAPVATPAAPAPAPVVTPAAPPPQQLAAVVQSPAPPRPGPQPVPTRAPPPTKPIAAREAPAKPIPPPLTRAQQREAAAAAAKLAAAAKPQPPPPPPRQPPVVKTVSLPPPPVAVAASPPAPAVPHGETHPFRAVPIAGGEPDYPQEYADEARAGAVTVSCTIEPSGSPAGCHVVGVQGGNGFSRAVLQWLGSGRVRYAPVLRDGQPITEPHQWVVHFKP